MILVQKVREAVDLHLQLLDSLPHLDPWGERDAPQTRQVDHRFSFFPDGSTKREGRKRTKRENKRKERKKRDEQDKEENEPFFFYLTEGGEGKRGDHDQEVWRETKKKRRGGEDKMIKNRACPFQSLHHSNHQLEPWPLPPPQEPFFFFFRLDREFDQKGVGDLMMKEENRTNRSIGILDTELEGGDELADLFEGASVQTELLSVLWEESKSFSQTQSNQRNVSFFDTDHESKVDLLADQKREENKLVD